MNAACRDFRETLSSVLRARAGSAPLAPVAWHEHLLACGDCRDLLEAEEALEALLASFPEPKLPAALAQRVLRRLAAARPPEAALDRLLDAVAADGAPDGLSQRVLARLQAARTADNAERALDRLLERVPAPAAPRDLAERVLAALGDERAAPPVSIAPARPARRTWIYALAATVAVALAALSWLRSIDRGAPSRGGDVVEAPPSAPTDDVARSERRRLETPAPPEAPRRDEPPVDLARSESEPDIEPAALDEPPADLLASLDLLESWDVLASGDLDFDLGSLDGVDEVLLDLEAELSAERGAAASESPTKG